MMMFVSKTAIIFGRNPTLVGGYHITVADYSDGKYYRYAYDSVGNRLPHQNINCNQPG